MGVYRQTRFGHTIASRNMEQCWFRNIGELGLSYMGGVRNKFQEDGLIFDEKRRLHVWAIDFNTTLPISKTWITSEVEWVNVDVPETCSQQFGRKQVGGFIDIVQPVFHKTIFGFERSVLNLALRAEYVDWNRGRFNETGTNIQDDFVSIVPGISWRPTAQTVVRLNYRYNWQTDLLGNPASRTAGFQAGFSSYF